MLNKVIELINAYKVKYSILNIQLILYYNLELYVNNLVGLHINIIIYYYYTLKSLTLSILVNCYEYNLIIIIIQYDYRLE